MTGLSGNHGPEFVAIMNWNLWQPWTGLCNVGIGVDKITENVQFLGRARVTLVKHDTTSLINTLPTADEQEEAIYNNIQLVELNAINAMLAMVKYKQMLGFYADEMKPQVLKYVSSWSKLQISMSHEFED